jgi:hypothetical protein
MITLIRFFRISLNRHCTTVTTTSATPSRRGSALHFTRSNASNDQECETVTHRECKTEECQVVSKKQCKAGTRRKCHTELSITTRDTVQNRQCGKVDE